MRLIAVCDTEAAPSVRRQIRAPEETVDVGSTRMSVLLRAGLSRWAALEERERADTCVMAVAQSDLRRDAVDYLRKTYVPGRAVALYGQDPYYIGGVHCHRLDPSFCVLLSPRALRAITEEVLQRMAEVGELGGSEGVVLGWALASAGVKCGVLGASVQYARPLVMPTMAEVDVAGDYLSR